MAVKLRLMRMGAKKTPFYRVVAIDSKAKRDGRYIELLGTYNPVVEPAEVKVDEELVLKWLRLGAIPTDTAKDLFSKLGIISKFHEEKMTSKKGKTAKKEPKKAAPKKEVKKETKAPAKKPAAKKPAAKKTTKKEDK